MPVLPIWTVCATVIRSGRVWGFDLIFPGFPCHSMTRSRFSSPVLAGSSRQPCSPDPPGKGHQRGSARPSPSLSAMTRRSANSIDLSKSAHRAEPNLWFSLLSRRDPQRAGDRINQPVVPLLLRRCRKHRPPKSCASVRLVRRSAITAFSSFRFGLER